MGKAEISALKRLGRGIAALALSVGAGYLTGKPYLVALTPVINAVAKWLRTKFSLQNIPI